MRDMLLLINLDAPASRSVAKKLRGDGYYCLVEPADAAPAEFPAEAKGAVLCGGTRGEAPHIPCLKELLAAGLPCWRWATRP